MPHKQDQFHFINFLRKNLEIFGHWPTGGYNFSRGIRCTLSVISAVILATMGTVQLFYVENVKELSANLAVTSNIVYFLFKLAAFKMNEGNFVAMHSRMVGSEIFGRYPGNCEFLVENTVKTCMVFFRLYFAPCCLVLFLYWITSMLTGILPVDLTYAPKSWFHFLCITQIVSLINVAFNTIYFDMLLIGCLGIGVLQLDVLKVKIEMGGGDKEHLVKCVQHHNKIIEYIEAVEKTFSFMILIQYLSSIFSMCNIGFQLVNITSFGSEFVAMFAYFFCMLLQLGVYCWYGNEIIIKSVDIGDAFFNTDWLEADLAYKKNLIFVIKRSNKYLKVTAGRFSHLSLRSLTSIMNSSYSYFALMQRLNNKRKEQQEMEL